MINKKLESELTKFILELIQSGNASFTLDDNQARTTAVQLGISGDNARTLFDNDCGGVIITGSDNNWCYIFSYWYGHEIESENGWGCLAVARKVVEKWNVQQIGGFLIGVGHLFGYDAGYMASQLPKVKIWAFNGNQ